MTPDRPTYLALVDPFLLDKRLVCLSVRTVRGLHPSLLVLGRLLRGLRLPPCGVHQLVKMTLLDGGFRSPEDSGDDGAREK